MEQKATGTHLMLILIVLVDLRISIVTGDELVVESPAGTFRGTVLDSLQGHLYKAFLGIPYAEPPVGALRFAKPKPIPKLEEVYEATSLPPICVQPVGVDLGSPAQEDCLYLNVYTPVRDQEVSKGEDELKKVFVYIHGGAFFIGSSREYMPGDLVALGDVIVITFNYRLSWLGFLKGNSTDLPGNQGLWDQLMALTWVKDNIRSFGGDPDDITIGGNSMGGESVSAWSVLSQSKNLFTKGFLMSGSMFACQSAPGSSDVLLKLLTERVGCEDEDVDATVDCLKALPVEKFILPIESSMTSKFTTIDGELFPRSFGAMLTDEDYLKNVGFYDRNYVISVTNNEGLIEYMGPFTVGIDPNHISAEFLSTKFHIPEEVCQRTLNWYRGPGHSAFNPAYDILGDPVLVMPTFKFLETFASYNNKFDPGYGKSYFLLFDYQPQYIHPPLNGMGHGIDLTYIFDIPPGKILWEYYSVETDDGFSEEDFKLKNLYIEMLVDFIKTGNPSPPLTNKFGLQWSAFDLEAERYLNFGPQPSIQQFPMKERRDFWKEVFPQYFEEYMQSQMKDEL